MRFWMGWRTVQLGWGIGMHCRLVDTLYVDNVVGGHAY
jgi:hypothetical protein